MAQLLCLSKLDGPSDLPAFPYDVVDCSDDEEEDEDRFFDGLTRRLTQPKTFAGVQSRRLAATPFPNGENHEVKSTLTGTTSCSPTAEVSQFQFPPPLETERFDMALRAAALELANLRMVPQEQQHFGTLFSEKQAFPLGLLPDQDRLPWTQNPNDPFSPLVSPSTLQRRHAGGVEAVNQRHDALWMAQQRRRRQQLIQAQIGKLGFGEGTRFGRTHSFPQAGWASKAGPYGIGSVSNRGSAGTGVFLPRGYGEVATESRRKSGCSTPTVIVPAKVARALNLNVHLQDHGGLLLARRDALLMQERSLRRPDGSLNHHEPCLLPREWTY